MQKESKRLMLLPILLLLLFGAVWVNGTGVYAAQADTPVYLNIPAATDESGSIDITVNETTDRHSSTDKYNNTNKPANNDVNSKTGDNSSMLSYVTIGVAALVVIAAILCSRRREVRKE